MGFNSGFKGLIYYSKSAVHVSGHVFAHHQEHLTVFTVSGSVHPSCCRLVSRVHWNALETFNIIFQHISSSPKWNFPFPIGFSSKLLCSSSLFYACYTLISSYSYSSSWFDQSKWCQSKCGFKHCIFLNNIHLIKINVLSSIKITNKMHYID